MGRKQSYETRLKISETCKKKGIGKWMLGRKHSEEQLKRMSESNIGKHSIKRPDITGEKHHYWKGDKVSYRNLHRWVESKLGKAHLCENNSSHKSTRYHWANISHEYKRDLADWKQLCPSCNGRDIQK